LLVKKSVKLHIWNQNKLST